jgi:hypothetical protein
MEPTESSETSASNTQTPGIYPKESILHLEHGEKIKNVAKCLCFVACYAMSNGEKLLTFGIIVLLSPSRSNSSMRHRTSVTIYLPTQHKVWEVEFNFFLQNFCLWLGLFLAKPLYDLEDQILRRYYYNFFFSFLSSRSIACIFNACLCAWLTHHTTKIELRVRVITLLILYRCAVWKFAGFTLRPLYVRGKPVVPVLWKGEWASDLVWTASRVGHKSFFFFIVMEPWFFDVPPRYLVSVLPELSRFLGNR